MQAKAPSARSSVIREAVIFTPIFGVLLAAWIAALILDRGAIPLLVMLGVLTLLIGFQSLQAVRDLFAKPCVTRGEIRRKWSHMVIHRGHYVYVGKNVFDIGALEYHEVKTGDVIEITHYPHTNIVVSVERDAGASGGRESPS